MSQNILITIGVVVLLSTFLLTTNRAILEHDNDAANNEYTATAVALAQSVIDEAKTKAFDQTTVSGSVSARTDLTANSSLGKDGSGEYVPVPDTLSGASYLSAVRFNDIDDYKGYTRKVNTSRAGNYVVSVAVNYASETYPDSVKTVQTYCKTFVVTVTHPNISSPVALAYPFTY